MSMKEAEDVYSSSSKQKYISTDPKPINKLLSFRVSRGTFKEQEFSINEMSVKRSDRTYFAHVLVSRAGFRVYN